MDTNWAWTTATIAALAMSGALTAGAAEEPAPTKKEAPATDKAQELADKYQVPVADVRDLRAKNMGWGEIRHALSLSQRSGKPLSEIMKLHDSGMGWGSIARKEGLKLEDHGRGGAKAGEPGRSGGAGRPEGSRGKARGR